MTAPRKPTAEELFDMLEEQAAADEADRIAALSDDELDRELAADGFDPAAERARARAPGDGKGSPPVPLAPVRMIRTRWLALLAAALVLALLGVFFDPHLLSRKVAPLPIGPDLSVASESPSQSPPPLPPGPAELRERAFAACAAKRWDECLAELDSARALDFSGDVELPVQRARHAAINALYPPPVSDGGTRYHGEKPAPEKP